MRNAIICVALLGALIGGAFAGSGFVAGHTAYVAVSLVAPIDLSERGITTHLYPLQRVRCGSVDAGCTYEIPACERVTVLRDPGPIRMRIRDTYGVEIAFRHFLDTKRAWPVVFFDQAECVRAGSGK